MSAVDRAPVDARVMADASVRALEAGMAALAWWSLVHPGMGSETVPQLPGEMEAGAAPAADPRLKADYAAGLGGQGKKELVRAAYSA